jgi:hypothetical protein
MAARQVEDDPRLAAAIATLAGLVLTRGPTYDERPAAPGQVRILTLLARAAHASAQHTDSP